MVSLFDGDEISIELKDLNLNVLSSRLYSFASLVAQNLVIGNLISLRLLLSMSAIISFFNVVLKILAIIF
jgi:hypothetical protein